ncbi:hypothetical protein BHE74_00055819 [Ensete ventricosum]|uniref:Uncharacterized protein n=1 Tax=Ensete ventricosum TaxID=4639 RepID=A0A444E1P5_ENSVE|nr:hypothetical protein B296_00039749 [Ensete ventricosum]RWW04290.1 hypothetical protein GW17_00032490 [Ensete ventricosum]RWW38904.1 hypothetical protein BHE74_00055819 [Ensete ventricosum]RZS17988.1 hypothetical protein BHM03_00050200 [Ensete ventricosum]
MSLISYRDLVGVAYTEEETKAMAAEIEVVDGPNDEGEMFTRPGKLSDRFPQPYSNEQAARFANGGAYPPDLSLITKMGKDVVTFLSWAAEPEMEERKLMGFKWIFVLSLALLQAAYYRRLKWSVIKSRKLVVDVVN